MFAKINISSKTSCCCCCCCCISWLVSEMLGVFSGTDFSVLDGFCTLCSPALLVRESLSEKKAICRSFFGIFACKKGVCSLKEGLSVLVYLFRLHFWFFPVVHLQKVDARRGNCLYTEMQSHLWCLSLKKAVFLERKTSFYIKRMRRMSLQRYGICQGLKRMVQILFRKEILLNQVINMVVGWATSH